VWDRKDGVFRISVGSNVSRVIFQEVCGILRNKLDQEVNGKKLYHLLSFGGFYRFRVPWDSRPYFTVSDLRLPFSSPPTTRRVTVEVFDPASTRVPLDWSQVKSHCDRRSVSQSVSLGVKPHLGLMTRYLVKIKVMLWPTVSRPVCLGIKHLPGAYDQIFITVRQLRVCWCGALSLREDGSVVYNCCWFSPAQSFSVPSPLGLATIFYCLRFEISPSQGRYLHIEQHKHRMNAHRHPCLEWDSNPWSQR
jgi:hypothetical protein